MPIAGVLAVLLLPTILIGLMHLVIVRNRKVLVVTLVCVLSQIFFSFLFI